MTDSNSFTRDEAAQQYAAAWAQSLAEILGQAGESLPCTVLTEAPREMAAVSASDLWILCACSGGLRGEMSLRLAPAAILQLAQTSQMLRTKSAAPGTEQPVGAEHREAALELLRQVAGLVTGALKPRWGEMQFRLDAAAGAASWPASSTFWLRAGDGEAVSAVVEIALSAALAAGLRTEKAETEKTETEIGTTTETEANRPSDQSPLAVARPSCTTAAESNINLDLLMDVDLAVTLRFGSRRLLLREVLDLNAGAVIDLDREVQEPVDVLLDGRLVARGEIVVIEGNYGLRVTEVAPGSGPVS